MIMDLEIKDTTEEETISVRYFEINGVKVKAYELYDVLGGLDGTCPIGRIVINNSKIKKLLEDLDVIIMSVKGSCWAGKKYEEFYAFIEEKIFEKY